MVTFAYPRDAPVCARARARPIFAAWTDPDRPTSMYTSQLFWLKLIAFRFTHSPVKWCRHPWTILPRAPWSHWLVELVRRSTHFDRLWRFDRPRTANFDRSIDPQRATLTLRLTPNDQLRSTWAARRTPNDPLRTTLERFFVVFRGNIVRTTRRAARCAEPSFLLAGAVLWRVRRRSDNAENRPISSKNRPNDSSRTSSAYELWRLSLLGATWCRFWSPRRTPGRSWALPAHKLDRSWPPAPTPIDPLRSTWVPRPTPKHPL